ncbi:MAG: hypothetical protein HWQ23_15305 [Nostoc sp. JL33]|uniref:hypothetical protein n=1 Tax=Nostoc sp. JL33 TaxID=2815396 RepID=UPI0025D838CC|nr:hypothetical protein [Nostoc sp. JL33]MBN3871588.1 hypothetical protein [Nostoc sp. JL33]
MDKRIPAAITDSRRREKSVGLLALKDSVIEAIRQGATSVKLAIATSRTCFLILQVYIIF